MPSLEEELALRTITKAVRQHGSVEDVDGNHIDEGVAIWDANDNIVGRVDYEPVGDGTFLTSYWYFDPISAKIVTENRIMSQQDLYYWINNDSEEYYLSNIKLLPQVEV